MRCSRGSSNVYSYDCNGHMTGRTVGGVAYTLVYDAEKVRRGEAVMGSNTTVYVGAIYEKMTSGGSTAGKGFIKRFGLTRGALAGAVAHDHHNLVVIGADDHSMMTAARSVGATRGGLVVAEGDKVLAQLPLSVAGLMSDQPIETVRGSYDDLLAARRGLSLSKGAGRVASTGSGRVSGDARSAWP